MFPPMQVRGWGDLSQVSTAHQRTTSTAQTLFMTSLEVSVPSTSAPTDCDCNAPGERNGIHL